MPVAVVVKSEERKELKSLPEGFVTIRRMTFGESLVRKDMMASVAMQMGEKQKQEDMRIQMDILSRKTTLWEFANLIIDHNLTDEKDRKLDFKNEKDVDMLVGAVGDEIQFHINTLNSFEEDATVKN